MMSIIVDRVSTTQHFEPGDFESRQKNNLITLWSPIFEFNDLTYKFRLATGPGGFTDVVSNAALLTTAALETRQRQERQITDTSWMDYSDLLSAVFTRLRQAAENVIEMSAEAEAPVANDIFLQILNHNPNAVAGTNDALAKECIQHFLNEEQLRTTGRLVIDHSKWAKPLQWANTVRLAQSGLNVDPDNIPSWEMQMHHSNLAEHHSELAAVLNLTEAALFCNDLKVPCAEHGADADSVSIADRDMTHYLPTRREMGANVAAWLWHTLVTEGGGNAAISQLERAHTSTLPFGSIKMSRIKFATTVFNILKQETPLLAIAEPMLALSEHTTTVSFGSNYVSGHANKLATWGVGIASTAIEEALQLAVATLYTLKWTVDNRITPQTRKLGQARALLQAPLLQGQNVSIEAADMPRVPYEVQLKFRQRPAHSDDMIQEIFKHVQDGVDAVRAQEGELVIEVHFDYQFYTQATPSWDPDTAYRTSYQHPREVFMSATASASECMESILDTIRSGFTETETYRKSVKVAQGERSVDRDWIGVLRIVNAPDSGANEILQENLMRVFDRIWQRQFELRPSTVVWQDPSLAAYPDRPSTWFSGSFDAPPGKEFYKERTTAKDHTIDVALEKAIINYIINPSDENIMVHITAVSDEKEFVCEASKLFLRAVTPFSSTVSLRICNEPHVANWDLTLLDVTKASRARSRGKIVFFSRSQANTTDEWEEKIRYKRFESKKEGNEPRNEVWDKMATVTLLEIKENKRKNLQVYYTKINEGRRYTYCGAVAPDTISVGDTPVTVCWEDGYQGIVKPSQLIVVAPNIRHRFAKSFERMEYEYDNAHHKANLLVSLDHLNVYNRPDGYLVVLVGSANNKLILQQGMVLNDENGTPKLFRGITADAQLWDGIGLLDEIKDRVYIRYNPKAAPQSLQANMGETLSEQNSLKFTLADINADKLPNLAINLAADLWTYVVETKSQIATFKGLQETFKIQDVFIEPVQFRPVPPSKVFVTFAFTKEKQEFLVRWNAWVRDGRVMGTDENMSSLLQLLKELLDKHNIVADTFNLKIGANDAGVLTKNSLRQIAVNARPEIKASANAHRFCVVNVYEKEVILDHKIEENDVNAVPAIRPNDGNCVETGTAITDNSRPIFISASAIPAKNKSLEDCLREAYNKAHDNCLKWLPPDMVDLKSVFCIVLNDIKTAITDEMLRQPCPKNLDGTYCDIQVYPPWQIETVLGQHPPFTLTVYGNKSWKCCTDNATHYYNTWLKNADYTDHNSTLDLMKSLWIAEQTDTNGVRGKIWVYDSHIMPTLCDDPKMYKLIHPVHLKKHWVARKSDLSDELQWGIESFPLIVDMYNRLKGWKDRWEVTDQSKFQGLYTAFSPTSPQRYSSFTNTNLVYRQGENDFANVPASVTHLDATNNSYIDIDNMLINLGKLEELRSIDFTNTPCIFDDGFFRQFVLSLQSLPKLKSVAFNLFEKVAPDTDNITEEEKGYISFVTFLQFLKTNPSDFASRVQGDSVLQAQDKKKIEDYLKCASEFARTQVVNSLELSPTEKELFFSSQKSSQRHFIDDIKKLYGDNPSPKFQTTPLYTYRPIVFGGTYVGTLALHQPFAYLVEVPGAESAPPSPITENVVPERAAKKQKVEEEVKVPKNREEWQSIVNNAYPRAQRPQENAEQGTEDDPLFGQQDDGEAYTKWRHTMEDNMTYAQFFRDPLPGNTKIVIKVNPNIYTVRANNRRTRQRLSNALMEGKVLHIADFQQEHVESGDGRFCWEVKNGRIAANPTGSQDSKSFTATAPVADVHKMVAGAFGGWHYARCTEPRQTAHANLMGPLMKDALHGLNAGDWLGLHESVNLNNVPDAINKNIALKYFHVLADIQNASPTLVADMQIMVKGPGRDSVATACRVPAVKMMTHMGKIVASEIDHQLVAVAMTLPKRIDPNCYGAKVRQSRQANCRSYFLNTNAHHALVRAFAETALADSVRAGAGKRYHHNLPVRAGQIALRSALHDLLMVVG